MHNFRKRIGEENFQAIMGMLVELFRIVGIITGQIISTDGTLLEAFARFRGCNYMEQCCKCIDCPNNLLSGINEQIKLTTEKIEKEDKMSKMLDIKMQCPREDVIEKMKKALKNKKKEVAAENIGAFCILKIKVTRNPVNGWQRQLDYLSNVLGFNIVVPEGYGIQIITCALRKDEESNLTFHCPRASKDITARTGYRRNKEMPNKTEPVFGYKAVIMTSVEIELELELPIMAATGSGALDEAKTFLKIHHKLKEYSAFKTDYHIMDSGYDAQYVYEYVRDDGANPIIDYNARNEKVDKKTLLARGYDEIGRPYALQYC